MMRPDNWLVSPFETTDTVTVNTRTAFIESVNLKHVYIANQMPVELKCFGYIDDVFAVFGSKFNAKLNFQVQDVVPLWGHTRFQTRGWMNAERVAELGGWLAAIKSDCGLDPAGYPAANLATFDKSLQHISLCDVLNEYGFVALRELHRNAADHTQMSDGLKACLDVQFPQFRTWLHPLPARMTDELLTTVREVNHVSDHLINIYAAFASFWLAHLVGINPLIPAFNFINAEAQFDRSFHRSYVLLYWAKEHVMDPSAARIHFDQAGPYNLDCLFSGESINQQQLFQQIDTAIARQCEDMRSRMTELSQRGKPTSADLKDRAQKLKSFLSPRVLDSVTLM